MKRSSTRNLATMLADILEDRIAERTPGSEEKVRISGVLGEGMQGKVMQGKWKGVDVAYKVVQLPSSTTKQDKAETRALLEMAISATMAHPNVVQTYSYEMVFVQNNSAANGKSNLGGSGVDDDAAMSAELLKSGSVATDGDGAEFFMESPATGTVTQKRSGGHYEARLIQVRRCFLVNPPSMLPRAGRGGQWLGLKARVFARVLTGGGGGYHCTTTIPSRDSIPPALLSSFLLPIICLSLFLVASPSLSPPKHPFAARNVASSVCLPCLLNDVPFSCLS